MFNNSQRSWNPCTTIPEEHGIHEQTFIKSMESMYKDSRRSCKPCTTILRGPIQKIVCNLVSMRRHIFRVSLRIFEKIGIVMNFKKWSRYCQATVHTFKAHLKFTTYSHTFQNRNIGLISVWSRFILRYVPVRALICMKFYIGLSAVSRYRYM